MSEADTVSSADVAGLNQAVVARRASLARVAGTGLLVVAGIGVLAWAWLVLRSLDVIGDFTEGEELGAADRVDLIASYTLYLMFASLAAGLGVALRLGPTTRWPAPAGSLTGVRAGEPLPSVRRWPPAIAETEPDA